MCDELQLVVDSVKLHSSRNEQERTQLYSDDWDDKDLPLILDTVKKTLTTVIKDCSKKKKKKKWTPQNVNSIKGVWFTTIEEKDRRPRITLQGNTVAQKVM